MEIQFRAFVEQDRPQLVTMISNFWDDLIALDPYKRMIHPPEYGEVYTRELLRRVAEQEGRLVWAVSEKHLLGFIAVEIDNQSEQNRVEIGPSRAGRIMELYVLPEYRGQGVGQEMIAEMERYLKQAGCDTIKIEVFSLNAGARRFYERLGYQEWVVDLFKRVS